MPFRPIRSIYTLLGLLLVPCCVAMVGALLELLQMVRPESLAAIPPGVTWLFGGFLLWIALFMVLPRPVKSYVLAHELSHALVGALMGARVSNLKVTENGGSVHVSKNNFLITLAPYFLPLYTLLVLVLYGILALFFDQHHYEPFWLGLVGLTYGYHLTFTCKSLTLKQQDIVVYGPLFSYVMIIILNLTAVALWVVAVGPPTLDDFVQVIVLQMVEVWGWLLEHGRAGLGALVRGKG